MYETYFKEYEDELNITIGRFLFWQVLNSRKIISVKMLNKMNETPMAWNFIRYSLFVNYILGLGRIFDTDGDSFSIDDLLKTCIEEIDIFTKEELRKRKAGSGLDSKHVDECISKAFEPTAKDFHVLRGEVSKRRKVFQDVYRPIRHKIIAHKDLEHLGNSDDLFSNTNVSEISDILEFLNSLQMALFGLYHNGRQPVLGAHKINREYYTNDFKKLLFKAVNV
jgi:hypothetical protein